MVTADEYFDSERKSRIIVAIFLSSLIHLGFLLFAIFQANPFGIFERNEPQVIPIELVNRLPEEVVQSFQETAEQRPEEARFASDRDLRTDEETSPELMGQDLARLSPGQQGGQGARGRERKVESFSLSDNEIAALNDPLQGGGASTPGTFSPGFARRLKRGDMLKVNALGLDYGQYFLRMKERIQQRWNPRSVISSAMYNYKEVVVGVAVVLNRQGELVDLRVSEKSLFPRFDQEALESIREAAPFPNPPDSLVQDDDRVYIPWYFTLYIGNWGASRID